MEGILYMGEGRVLLGEKAEVGFFCLGLEVRRGVTFFSEDSSSCWITRPGTSSWYREPLLRFILLSIVGED